MAKRTYHQYCGLAAALDVVGERWALLVVRDLVPGPRRFTDLFEGLPGIATDVLAERLRSLEAAGAVEQQTLRHPVPAKVYALTERGHQLARIAGDLAGWGMPLLPARPTREQRTNPRWALQTMARNYRGGLAAGSYRWTIADQQLTVVVAPAHNHEPETATVEYGPGPEPVVLDAQCTAAAFFAMADRGDFTRSVALEEGSTGTVAAFFRAMPLPTRAGASTPSAAR